METVDEEFIASALDFMDRKTKREHRGSVILILPGCMFSRT
jgi:hypothetical protein